MSLYALQKLIRDVNRRPEARAAWLQDSAGFATGYDLVPEELAPLLARDWGALYGLGVHGLLLRPFSILHNVPEPDYLCAIRGEEE